MYQQTSLPQLVALQTCQSMITTSAIQVYACLDSFILIILRLLFHYRLEDLWLNDNNISSVEDIAEAVAGSRQKLTTIYLERNPCVCIHITPISTLTHLLNCIVISE